KPRRHIANDAVEDGLRGVEVDAWEAMEMGEGDGCCEESRSAHEAPDREATDEGGGGADQQDRRHIEQIAASNHAFTTEAEVVRGSLEREQRQRNARKCREGPSRDRPTPEIRVRPRGPEQKGDDAEPYRDDVEMNR